MSAFAAPIVSLSKLGTWQDPQLLASAQVEAVGIGRFALRSRTDDLWNIAPFREKAVAAALKTCLRSSDTFVDAGANIGAFSVLGSTLVGESGRVIAVEMMPATAAMLRRNIALNGLRNVSVVERALSDQDGQEVTACCPAGKHGQARVQVTPTLPSAMTESVQTVTLDTLLLELNSIRLIKMDLEGMEPLALRGARAVLSKTDYLIFEDWSQTGEDAGEAHDLLISLGFKLIRLDRNNLIACRRGEGLACLQESV